MVKFRSATKLSGFFGDCMKLLKMALALMVMSSSLEAQDINITGTISRTLKIPMVRSSTTRFSPMHLSEQTKQIKLLRVELSEKSKQLFANKAQHALAHTKEFSNNALYMSEKFPAKVQLGMNGVPVLNQGNHGSCVVFAITAAVDAVLNKGDYISQLCQLQVGNYLAASGYIPSGWNGTIGRFVLGQMESTGIVNKQDQATQGCGGLMEYPINGDDPESAMTLDEFHQLSEPFDHETVSWWTLLDLFDVATERVDTSATLAEVKKSLLNGDRVAFGVLLLDFEYGLMGAVGKKGAVYDSWVLTPEIARDVYLRPFFGGHEMVITGYDDNAVAIDDKGRPHKGLLTLRNSWGDQVGDQGNFYMSYDYFVLLVIEAQRIHNAINDDVDGPSDLGASA